MQHYILVIATLLTGLTGLFQPSEAIADNQICKYVEQGPGLKTSIKTPEIYSGLSNVVVWPTTHTYEEITNNDILNVESLAKLTECTLASHTSLKISATTDRQTHIFEWPEAQEEKTLLIWLKLGFATILSEDENSKELLSLTALYYRPDVQGIKSIEEYCTVNIPYFEDNDKMLKALTKAMNYCLDKPYD